MCNMDCLNCGLPDCQNDKLTDAERSAQNSYDRELKKERIPEERRTMRKGRLAVYDYEHTEKRKAGKKRYIQSEKGKAALKRYEQREKGKERQRRARQKKVASGKNAEYCRAYYYRKKAEREAAANGKHNEK